MSTFEPGQLVTCNEFGRYTITNKGKPLEVTSVSYNRIRVKCLWGDNEEFSVNPSKFRPMSKNEIFKPGQKLITESPKKVRGNNTEKIVTFIGYSTYGVKVETSTGHCITLSMHSVKGVVKGGLHV